MAGRLVETGLTMAQTIGGIRVPNVTFGQALSDLNAQTIVDAYRRAVDAQKPKVLEIVQFTAIAHEAYLQRTYPLGHTGNLRRGVFITKRNEYSWRVTSGAPHAHLWELGSRGKVRQTRAGYNRGVMPAHGSLFVDSAIRYRGDMVARVQAYLDRPVEV